MEGRHVDAEAIGLAAHLVERDEAVENIEGRVLDRLGHDRRGELLQLEREAEPLAARCLGEPGFALAKQNAAQKVEDRRVDVGALLTRDD